MAQPQTIAEMVAASAAKVGSSSTPSAGSPEDTNARGIEIKHQNIELAQGQAKSGLNIH